MAAENSPMVFFGFPTNYEWELTFGAAPVEIIQEIFDKRNVDAQRAQVFIYATAAGFSLPGRSAYNFFWLFSPTPKLSHVRKKIYRVLLKTQAVYSMFSLLSN